MISTKEQGKRFASLIASRDYTINKFAKLCCYDSTNMYRLCSGDRDLSGVFLSNIIIFVRILKLDSIDEFCELVGIDLLKDII